MTSTTQPSIIDPDMQGMLGKRKTQNHPRYPARAPRSPRIAPATANFYTNTSNKQVHQSKQLEQREVGQVTRSTLVKAEPARIKHHTVIPNSTARLDSATAHTTQRGLPERLYTCSNNKSSTNRSSSRRSSSSITSLKIKPQRLFLPLPVLPMVA